MRILLTGATGLIGTALTEKLLSNHHQVNILTRGKHENSAGVDYYQWNPEAQTIDNNAFENVEAIINLAGANVGAQRWTKEFKQEILDSRVQSTLLLKKHISLNNSIKVFINGSATGIYGINTGEAEVDENSNPASDFLANVVKDWENALFHPEIKNVRSVALRLGIVFSDQGGALPKMAKPIKYGVGAPLGTGKQYISWVDIEDVVEAFLFCLNNPQISGAYNIVSSEPVKNDTLTHQIAEYLKRPVLLPNIPSFALKLLLGEFADSVLGGSKISNKKIITAGFHFKYPDLKSSLRKNISV